MSTSAISQCKSTAEQITEGINKIKEERKNNEKERKSINQIYNLVQNKIKKAKTPIEEEEPTKGGSKGKSRKYRKKILFKKRRTRRRRRKF